MINFSSLKHEALILRLSLKDEGNFSFRRIKEQWKGNFSGNGSGNASENAMGIFSGNAFGSISGYA